MQVSVNNELIDVNDGASVVELVQSQDSIPDTGIAVAVNSEVVPQSLWESKILNSNDNILIIQATQGG